MVEVHAIGLKRIFGLSIVWPAFGGRLASAGDGFGDGIFAVFGDAVTDIIDRVIAGHIPFLQEIDGMALALCKQSDQGVCAGHFFAAGGLNMNNGALNDAVETGRGAAFLKFFDNEAFQIVV